MRILYVAFTRAKEKLIITGATRELEKSINNWISSASLDQDIILPSEVLKGKSYLDWIAMAMCKHRDGEPLREYVGATRDIIKNDFSTWNIKFWSKSMLIGDKKVDIVDESKNEDLLISLKNGVVDKQVIRRLGYNYKFFEGGYLPSNISVSDLKKNAFEDEDMEIVELFKIKEIIKPKFLQEEKALTSAERGTIMHFVMQRLNLDRVNSIYEIKAQIVEMVADNSLTEKEADSVWHKKILNFYKSDLGERLLSAYKNNMLVSKELPFFTEISSLELNPDLDKETYQDENIRLQGIIDCFFEEKDGIVLLDYKTDYVEEANEEEIVDRYRLQLKYYKDALEKITGKRVKESYLYLFGLDKEIKIN